MKADSAEDSPLLTIVGPTASGKTAFAVALARRVGGEIVSGDSRQVYRGMDIGTGKDLDEYGEIPCHLIDVADAGTKYNLFQYLRDADSAIADIRHRGRRPILCGGTGMYVESLLKGLQLPPVPENPELRASLAGKPLAELADILAGMKRLHNTTDIDTAQRAIRAIEIEVYYQHHPDEGRLAREGCPRRALIVGVDVDREVRRQRILRRLDARLEQGMVEEIKALLESGVPAENLIYYGLEYKFVTEYVLGRTTLEKMKRLLGIAICQFAKRQMTWWRGMERRGFHIHWVSGTQSPDEFAGEVLSLMNAEDSAEV